MKLVTRTATALALLVALAFAALLVVPPLLGLQRYVIETGSMTGSLDPGTLIFDEMVAPEDLRVGDVITYNPPPEAGLPGLVTHRIVEIQRGPTGFPLILTKGDANNAPDKVPFVASQAEIARVKHDVPHVGRAIAFLNTPDGRKLLFALPALLIAGTALRDFWRKAGAAGADRAAKTA